MGKRRKCFTAIIHRAYREGALSNCTRDRRAHVRIRRRRSQEDLRWNHLWYRNGRSRREFSHLVVWRLNSPEANEHDPQPHFPVPKSPPHHYGSRAKAILLCSGAWVLRVQPSKQPGRGSRDVLCLVSLRPLGHGDGSADSPILAEFNKNPDSIRSNEI